MFQGYANIRISFGLDISRCLLVGLACFSVNYVLPRQASADDPSRDSPNWSNWSDRPALFSVRTQTYAKPADNTSMPSNSLMMASPIQPGPLEPYLQGFSSDWSVPEEVDPEDPFVRLILITPDHPLVIDVALFNNGEPFERHREELLKAVLSRERTVEKPNDANENLSRSPAITKLEQIAASKTKAPDLYELRWLLAQFIPGPTLLCQNQSYSVKRGRIAPLWQLADANQDDILDEEEQNRLSSLVKQADQDRDQILNESELLAATNKITHVPALFNWPLELIVISRSPSNDRDLSRRSVSKLYSHQAQNENSSYAHWLHKHNLNGTELLTFKHLQSLSSDLTLKINFSSSQTGVDSKIELLSESPLLKTNANSTTLLLESDSAQLEISGWTDQTNSWSDNLLGQLSIGAALDGSPLFRQCDTDGDRRLSVREQSEIPAILEALDVNKDGQLTPQEVKVPIRLALATGPVVHQVLSHPVGISRETKTSEPVPLAPDWFLGMDENKDNDLSRQEFLGSDEQFSQLDGNKDGLVDVKEALGLSSP